ncbi:hypothetical protein B6D60_11095 [candidate division KSB1 bacterium 4484_87]|nr:MAG: hypothetical protein B6D60_11095 [candidate division KSB1 bacterium 4484_87]
MRVKLKIAILTFLASLLFCIAGCYDKISDPSAPEENTELTSSHPGWQKPNCWECHQPEKVHPDSNFTIEKNPPYTCVACHGNNGAPKGHRQFPPCGDCHLQKHSDMGFPDPVSCQTCHKN